MALLEVVSTCHCEETQLATHVSFSGRQYRMEPKEPISLIARPIQQKFNGYAAAPDANSALRFACHRIAPPWQGSTGRDTPMRQDVLHSPRIVDCLESMKRYCVSYGYLAIEERSGQLRTSLEMRAELISHSGLLPLPSPAD
jgi:hypothetical protein